MTADHLGAAPPPGAGTIPSTRVAVVGAGIAGLAAALRIAQGAPELDLVIFEAGARPGGVIATERGGDSGEYLVEAGPDSFLTEKPEALRFCEDLGIAGTLRGVQATAARTYVVHRGRLTPVPEGFRILAPTRLGPWLRSPLFSWPGKLRMAMDWFLPRGRPIPDESVASFVTRRLGREAFDRIGEPMIGTIYTGDAATLSLAATMPRFIDLERGHGSVIRGLVAGTGTPAVTRRPATARPAGGAGPGVGLFAAPANGMQSLVDAAAARLPAGTLRLQTPAVSVAARTGGRRYRVTLADGNAMEADGVLVATSAPPAGRLLAGLDETLAGDLAAIRYASSVSVTVGYRRAEVRHPLDGVGFVVPRVERRPILAASFSSVKFARRAPADRALIRVFLGGALAPGMLDMDDDGLVATVRREMDTLLGTTAAPHFVRVHRYRDAMPQYVVGHLARAAAIESRVAAHPGLALAGAAYRGVGISDCIRSGEAAADVIVAHVRRPAVAPSQAVR